MDQKLLFLVNREWTHPALDWIMAAASAFEIWIIPIAALAIALWLRGGLKGRAFLIVAALAVGLCDGVLAKNLKRAADRPRPHQALPDVRTVDLAKARFRPVALFKPLKIKMSRPAGGEIDGRSFPSSHTMNTVAVALVCAAFYPRRGWLAFLPATIVAYSRVYTGSHWPSDVLGSILLGCGVTLLFLAACEAAWRRWAPRYLSALATTHPWLLGP